VETGGWVGHGAEAVHVPATLGLENGVWFQIRQGVRSLLARDEAKVARVYLICEPALLSRDDPQFVDACPHRRTLLRKRDSGIGQQCHVKSYRIGPHDTGTTQPGPPCPKPTTGNRKTYTPTDTTRTRTAATLATCSVRVKK
jgi:hypothetical protein